MYVILKLMKTTFALDSLVAQIKVIISALNGPARIWIRKVVGMEKSN